MPTASPDAIVAAWTATPDEGVRPGVEPPASRLEPGLTAVICTAGRPDAVARCLASLAAQTRRPDRLMIVDASRDDTTERVVRTVWTGSGAPAPVAYIRVGAARRGLTRQRNLALARVRTDLVVFFDDDIVADSACLAEMLAALDAEPPPVVGVGAYAVNQFAAPDLRWRIRRRLGIVTDLRPGRYHRSGMSIPWSFLPPTDGIVEGDWLPGYAMLWRTGPARAVGFRESFAGYAQGEDLDFSLRMRRAGRLVIAGRAIVRHDHHPGGRCRAFELGYQGVRNRYVIHRTALPDRTWRDAAWFVYAWVLDGLVHLAGALRARPRRDRILYVLGGVRAGVELLAGAARGVATAGPPPGLPAPEAGVEP